MNFWAQNPSYPVPSFDPHENFVIRSPLGRRFTKLEEVANLVLFLLTDLASVVHAASVMSDAMVGCTAIEAVRISNGFKAVFQSWQSKILHGLESESFLPMNKKPWNKKSTL